MQLPSMFFFSKMCYLIILQSIINFPVLVREFVFGLYFKWYTVVIHVSKVLQKLYFGKIGKDFQAGSGSGVGVRKQGVG